MVGTRAVQVHPYSREKGAPIRSEGFSLLFFFGSCLGFSFWLPRWVARVVSGSAASGVEFGHVIFL